MRLAGFDAPTVAWVEESYETSRATGVALPGEMSRVIMFDPATGSLLSSADRKVITGADYVVLLDKWETQAKQKLSVKDWDTYLGLKKSLGTTGMGQLKVLEEKADVGLNPMRYAILSSDSATRLNVEGVASLFFVPARALLPEVKVQDIRPLEWAVGGAQIAAWTLPFVPKGVLPFVSGGAASIFGYSTAQNWDKLSTAQKVLAVTGTTLIALPALAALGKTIAPVAVKVPVRAIIKGEGGAIRLGRVKGEVTIWRGIQVNGKPIFGISQSKPTLGTWGIKRPTLAQVERGWHPVTKIETTLLGTEKALKAMGVSADDIAKVKATWQEAVPLFARKPSPAGVTPREILAGSQRLTPQETAAILKVAVKHGKKVDMIYGSSTMRPQLKAALRDWRQWHDIDIQTTMTGTELTGFVDDMMRELQKLGTKVRVNPDMPGAIEKFVNGVWEKITDIHVKDVVPGSSGAWETGAYGYLYAEKPIVIKLPGVGTLNIMTLSETGLRKAGAITRFQVTEIAPYAYRVNDIADFYTILLNYKGAAIADDWATAFGYTSQELLKVAAKSPQQWSTWALSPSVSMPGRSPTVAITVPSLYVASIPRSLRAQIESPTPIPSPGLVGEYIVRASPSSVRVVSPGGKLSPSVIASPSVRASVSGGRPSPAPSVSPSPLPSPSGGRPSPSASVSPAPSPSASVSPSPRPSPSPAPSASPTPSPAPSPAPSPSPYPVPYPVSYPSPHPAPVPSRPLRVVPDETKDRKIPEGSIAWKQGIFWKYIPPPWTQEKPITLSVPPIGARFTGERTPEKTIQMIGKPGAKVPRTVTVDLGVVDIKIDNYGRTISFTGKGLETVTGHSIPGAAAGMSIPGGGVMKTRPTRRKKLTPGVSAL